MHLLIALLLNKLTYPQVMAAGSSLVNVHGAMIFAYIYGGAGGETNLIKAIQDDMQHEWLSLPSIIVEKVSIREMICSILT